MFFYKTCEKKLLKKKKKNRHFDLSFSFSMFFWPTPLTLNKCGYFYSKKNGRNLAID
jgi:hypothetical protein